MILVQCLFKLDVGKVRWLAVGGDVAVWSGWTRARRRRSSFFFFVLLSLLEVGRSAIRARRLGGGGTGAERWLEVAMDGWGGVRCDQRW